VTIDRAVRLAVHHRTSSTMHSRVTVGGCFCGQHSRCARYHAGQPCYAAICMSDAYFTVTQADPEFLPKEFESPIQDLGLACRESRACILSRYPLVAKVYRLSGPVWSSSRQVRTVHCNPATDILVITAVPSYSSAHADPSTPLTSYEEASAIATDRRFPDGPEPFINFRQVVSSFHNVGFDFIGARDVGRRGRRDLTENTDFKIFLFWFESMRNLYVWPNPAYWPEVQISGLKVHDARDLPRKRHLREIFEAASDVLADYNEYAAVQNDHVAEDDKHWVPRPRKIEKIGCYAAAFWLMDDGTGG
jgi:hypothetical protein